MYDVWTSRVWNFSQVSCESCRSFSSQLEFGKCVVGRCNDVDAIDEAVEPGAKTRAGVFNDECSPQQLRRGECTIRSFISSGEGEFILLDENSLVLGNDKAKEIVTSQFDYQLQAVAFGGLFHLFTKPPHSAIGLHAPFGYAGDSRRFVSLEDSARRFQLIEFCACLCRIIRREDVIFPVNQNDAIVASAVFETVINGWHQGRRPAAAASRDVLTPPSVFACIQNALAKSEDGAAITDVALRPKILRCGEPDRPLEQMIIVKATNFLSQATPTTIKDRVSVVQKLFTSDSPTSSTLSKRWELVFSRELVPGSPLAILAAKIRDNSFKSNSGNTDEYKDFDLDENDKEFLAMKALNGKYFWIRDHGTKESANNPNVGSKYPVFKKLSLPGLRRRIGNVALKYNKGNTSHQKSVKDPNLGCERHQPRKDVDGYALVRLVAKK